MEALQQAMIVVTWNDKERTIEFIPVQFNPTQLSFNKGVQIAEIPIPGLDSPLIQFVRGQDETLSIDLFFDSTENGMGAGATSVTQYSDQIYQLVKIEPDSHAPPPARNLARPASTYVSTVTRPMSTRATRPGAAVRRPASSTSPASVSSHPSAPSA